MQQSFITNNQVRPDLTLFNSQDSRAVFGNLLTLPIGGSGLLYVEPLYVAGPGENSFPLLQKVLVNYGDRVGYGDTLEEALDQVFGAGVGEAAVGGEGGTRRPRRRLRPTPHHPDDADHAAATAGRRRPARSWTTRSRDIERRSTALADRRSATATSPGQGQALEDLQAAVEAYQAAQQAAATASPTG